MAWAVTCAGLVLLILSEGMLMASVGLFLAGAGCESAIRIMFAALGEVVDYFRRQSFGVGLQCSFGMAGIFIGVVYYGINNWRVIMFVFCCLPSIICLLLIWRFFEETPKFLMKKSTHEAYHSLSRIA